MASVITGNKAAAVDFHIVEKYCDKTKKGYKTALKGKKETWKRNKKSKKGILISIYLLSFSGMIHHPISWWILVPPL